MKFYINKNGKRVFEINILLIILIILLVFVFASKNFGEKIPPEALKKFSNHQAKLLEEVKHKRDMERRWFWATQGVLVVSSYYDIDSTMDALERCPNCIEGNPLLKPFMKDRQTAYLAMAGLDTLQIYLNYRIFKKGSKMWIGPSAVSIGTHAYGYSVNVRIGY